MIIIVIISASISSVVRSVFANWRGRFDICTRARPMACGGGRPFDIVVVAPLCRGDGVAVLRAISLYSAGQLKQHLTAHI